MLVQPKPVEIFPLTEKNSVVHSWFLPNL